MSLLTDEKRTGSNVYDYGIFILRHKHQTVMAMACLRHEEPPQE